MIKYMNNCFFATKVSFLNEMYQIADACGADWDMAVEGFVRDGRVGHSHMNVPGPDGKFGFGGSCFQKDLLNMIYLCRYYGLEEVADYWEQVVILNDWQKKRISKLIIETFFGTVTSKKCTL